MTIEHDGKPHWSDNFCTTKAQYYALLDAKQQSGFEPMPKSDSFFRPNCGDFSHCPPTHLHVPAGMRYRHVCPSCGMITYINSSEVVC